MKKILYTAFGILLLTALIGIGGCSFSHKQTTASDQTESSVQNTYSDDSSSLDIKNRDEVIESLQHGLKNRARSITIRFYSYTSVADNIKSYISELINDAFDEATAPDEGDYIRFQYGGYEMNYTETTDGDTYKYEVKITPKYYTYRIWEDEVDLQIADIVEQLDLSSDASEEEKIHSVYDYIINTLSYDKINKKYSSQHLKTTAYAALKYHTVVCQGYAVLAYRLFREVGVESRIVTGDIVNLDGETERHAWNIVGIDGKYYNIDLTWDDQIEDSVCYLKSDNDLEFHTKDEKYLSELFLSKYPMSDKSY